MAEFYEDIIDGAGRKIGERLVTDGSLIPAKLNYVWSEFVGFLTDTEFDALLAPQNNRLARFIEARGLNFENSRDLGIAADLVTANILTVARADALVG